MKKALLPIYQDELDLIRKAQQGDDHAFTQLVKRYENLVYSFAFKMCRNKEKAEETWQDTFVNVYRKLGQFDGKSKFSTWMYSIVTNNCLMKQRIRKLDQASVSIDLPDSSHDDSGLGEKEAGVIVAWRETPLDSVMDKELKLLLDEAIRQLPPDYRVVFILRDIEGQSAEETAKILKLSVPAVKSRLRRARVFLRDRLNGYMTS
ncbi:MAG: sigma-70 family RNA polymerase sigma factor [bacterium]